MFGIDSCYHILIGGNGVECFMCESFKRKVAHMWD